MGLVKSLTFMDHMLPSALFVLHLLAPDTLVYRGARHELRVELPRIDAEITVDGALTEPVWARAARLTEFTQYSPVDNRPAEDSTEVLVWYSPTAIHFGVRAHAQPGTVRAHLTARDAGILTDDYIEIQLGTFKDGRQIFMFASNPLGVQADGALVEGAQAKATFGTQTVGREQADLSPDYVFDSKGRLTEAGYEIEIRIPFASLKYQRANLQDWSLQIIRKSAYSNREDTWAPAQRAASSFIGQAGSLAGLQDIRRGLVLELNPSVTSTVDGAPNDAGRWEYTGGRPQVGGGIKWGLTPDLTLNGTVNPDFSQVEADVGQIAADPRVALFFPEKRPFFLDGLEYFTTPTQLIYTRRIASPVAATKVTGSLSGTSIAFLSAVDSKETSASGNDNPVYNILRVQRDIGSQSRLGLVYTDKIDGHDYNRVIAADAHLVTGGINSFLVTAAVSRTRSDSGTRTGPSWLASFTRTGRTFGLQASVRGFSEDFEAQSGFIGRGALATFFMTPSITLYGKKGGIFERFVGSMNTNFFWVYDDFVHGRASQDRQLHFFTTWTLRGGWTLNTGLLFESFGFDKTLYADYRLQVPTKTGFDTVAFTGTPRLYNRDYNISLTTPQIKGFALTGFYIWGKDENFLEWSSGNIGLANLALTFRPTEKLRFESSYALRFYNRRSDGTNAGRIDIPRLKVEYQVSRAVFLRLVGQYTSNRQSDLRDDSRTNYPILIRDPTDGVFKLATAREDNVLRVDWLFSYQPSPGTVFFAGYGSSLSEPLAFRFRRFERTSDGFFLKLSYLFHA